MTRSIHLSPAKKLFDFPDHFTPHKSWFSSAMTISSPPIVFTLSGSYTSPISSTSRPPSGGLESRFRYRLMGEPRKHAIANSFASSISSGGVRHYLGTETCRLAQQHWPPRQIFMHLVDQLTAQRLENPHAVFLSPLIATMLTQHRLLLARRVGTHLTPPMSQGLPGLLTPVSERPGQMRYRLSQLKRLSQATKPAKGPTRLQDLEDMRRLYQLLTPSLLNLDLPQPGIISYATSVVKLDLFALTRRPEHDRSLPLLAFVIHHDYRLHDHLVDVFLNALSSLLHSVQREHMEPCYAERETHSKSLTALLTILATDVLPALKTLKQIATSFYGHSIFQLPFLGSTICRDASHLQ